MTENIKFSITVPAYKAKFLVECIDSILAQTYKNFELIIVNDNSPQDLDSLINQYSDTRICYYKNEIGFGAEHVVGNWNTCLKYATGDYIICMGDDDKLLPNCLEEYSKLIEKYPGLGLYHGWTEKIDENSEVVSILIPSPEWESCYSFIHSKLSGRKGYIGDYLFDAELLRKNGGFYDLPYAWGSDDMSVYIASLKNGLANTQVPVFQFRISRYSISSSAHNKEKLLAIDKQFKWIRDLLSENKHEQTYYDRDVRNHCLSLLPFLFKKQVAYYMLADMKVERKLVSLCYWFRNRNRYHLASKEIAKSFLKSFL